MVELVNGKYPGSPLLPKFLFLKALSIGKTQSQAMFEDELYALIARYPESDISSISKDMIALM